MYEIENEDHIAIDRNDGNTEYAGEGYGKSRKIVLCKISNYYLN